MSYEPEPIDRVLLWRLAVAGGETTLKQLGKPDPDRNSRKRLLKAGFTAEETRKPESGGRGVLHLSLDEKGWAYLNEHPTEPISPTAKTAPILQGLLFYLHRDLVDRQMTISEFFHPPVGRPGIDRDVPAQAATTGDRPGAQVDGRAEPSDLRHRIEEAYLRTSGGERNVRVRLADLRDTLSDVPRTRLDEALMELADRGDAALYRLDNPLEIRDRDRDAVLMTPAGDPRHIIYLGGRGS